MKRTVRKFSAGITGGMREVIGRRARRIVSLLDEQLTATCEGAELAITMAKGRVARDDARSQISVIEHRGDSSRNELVGVLISTLVTPIDREDLYRLSRSIDDILDSIRDFIRESDLFEVGSQDRFINPLSSVLTGVNELQQAIRLLTFNPYKATRHALACRRSATEIRILYQTTLADLFQEDLTMESLKVLELMRRTDVIAMSMNTAADALNDGLFKRQYSQR